MSIASLHCASGQYVFRAPEANIRSFIGWTCGRNEVNHKFGKRKNETILMTAMAIGVSEMPPNPLFESAADMMQAVGKDGILDDIPIVDIDLKLAHRMRQLQKGLVEWFVLTTRGLYLFYGDGDEASNYKGFFIPKGALANSTDTYFIGIMGEVADTIHRTGLSDNSLTAFRTVGRVGRMRGVELSPLNFADIIEATYPQDGTGATSWSARFIMV